jgi:hypothetical protein
MPPSAETVCANPAPIQCRLEASPLWLPDPLEIGETLRMRFRAIAWGALLSTALWATFFLACRVLWNLWR